LQTSDVTQDVLANLPFGSNRSSSSEFLVLPGRGTPRWLLPANGDLDTIFANWSPYRPSSRAKWRAIRTAHRMGVLALLPNVKSVQLQNADAVDWRAVGWTRHVPPTPVVYLGTPGPHQKAVIHLVDSRSGVCEAIVKVPLAEQAKHSILREAGILLALNQEEFCGAPHLLYLDRERGITTRELRNVLERAALLSEYKLVRSEHLHFQAAHIAHAPQAGDGHGTLKQMECSYINHVLHAEGGAKLSTQEVRTLDPPVHLPHNSSYD